MSPERREELPLPEAVTHLLEECRMVLPGIQALFGFQLIAVFNAGFGEKLSVSEQRLHLLALGLVAIAGALVLAPAAYHRQTGPLQVSESFVILASRLLLSAMIPLMLGIGLDFYLISRVILEYADQYASRHRPGVRVFEPLVSLASFGLRGKIRARKAQTRPLIVHANRFAAKDA